jgi:hypothetical protein
MPACTRVIIGKSALLLGLNVGSAQRAGESCMATAIIFLISAICGVCVAGIAVAVALVVWPESKTLTNYDRERTGTTSSALS